MVPKTWGKKKLEIYNNMYMNIQTRNGMNGVLQQVKIDVAKQNVFDNYTETFYTALKNTFNK